MPRLVLYPIAAFIFISGLYLSCGESESSDDGSDESATPGEPGEPGDPGKPGDKPDKPGDKPDGGTTEDAGNGTETETADGCRGGAETSIADEAPDWIKENFTCVTVTMSDDGESIIINTKDLPNYKTAYYGSDDAWYEEMPSGNQANPNDIVAQNYTVTIPGSPTVNSTTTATGMDLVGVAVNGVAIYNNAAAPGDTLANEFDTFDSGNGHPTMTGSYHYHTDPLKITTTDKELVGVMRDGFPIYAKLDEDGTTPDDLDDAHGHEHATSHFPDGIYHYHVTEDDPYIIEVYRGTPGDMTNN